MSTSMKCYGIDQLPPEDRVELALEIWESLGNDRPVGRIHPDQRVELPRRAAELDANPDSALSWEEIRAPIEG